MPDKRDPEPEITCCGILEKLEAEHDLPFSRPIRLVGNALVGGEWAVRVMTLTKSGRISRAAGSSIYVFLEFCPFCGRRLRQNPDEPAALDPDIQNGDQT